MPVGEDPWDQACKTLVIASSVDQGMSKVPPDQAPLTGKGKGVALPVIPDELRHNARLRSKQDTAKGAGRGNETGTSSTSSVGVSQSGTTPLISNFPYSSFSDDEIIILFEDSGFSLGSDMQHKLDVIQKFRSL